MSLLKDLQEQLKEIELKYSTFEMNDLKSLRLGNSMRWKIYELKYKISNLKTGNPINGHLEPYSLEGKVRSKVSED